MAKRVSYEQRSRMLEFMRGHEDLARGRVVGPDAARQKKRLLEELAEELNSLGSGASKSPEKWLKCWQDWKSDVKAKALKIKKAQAGTGGGPCPAPLSPLEENLLLFFGVEMVDGLAGVPDPMEVPASQPIFVESEVEVIYEEPKVQKTSDTKIDPLHNILERQAAALEGVAAGMQAIAVALQQIAAALQHQH